MEVNVNLILQIVILVLGLIGAYLAKKGLIDRKDLEDSKAIARDLAASVDELKQKDPDAAAKLIGEILTRIGDRKPVLDEFLKIMNLNKPHP
jgi:hypothetical protein